MRGARSWDVGDIPGDIRMRVLGHVTLWVPCPQVPFFLFVVFVVYALLPLSTRAAIAVGVASTVSHLLVFGAVTRAFKTSMSSTQLGLQVRVAEAGWEQALAWRSLNFGTVLAGRWL